MSNGGGGDDDKTVFGGKLPIPGGRPAGGDNGRTIIGGALPPAQGGNTWIGGALPGQPTPPPQPPQHVPPPFGASPPMPGREIGQAPGQSQGFFPDLQSSQPAQQPNIGGPRISLQDAMRTTSLGAAGSSNLLVAAAANLLILLGRLRTGLVEMQAAPLMEHVTREIDSYERALLQGGVDPTEAQVAKYALCGTADDIVQNLPGADRGAWVQYSMVARFFGKRDSGVGFFQEAEQAMQAPGQRYNLLELMLTCLSLGFEGQYRTLPNGAVELGKIRAMIYETLRRVQPRPDEEVSVRWQAVPLGKRRRFGSTPNWIVAAFAALAIVALFATMSTLLSRDGSAVEQRIFAMHPQDLNLTIERSAEVTTPYVAQSTQLERIEDSLTTEIDAGKLDVGRVGEFIYVRVGNLSLFAPGSSELRPDFEPLALRIAEILEAESGPVRVVGHTDSTRVSARSRFKNNQELSVARATAVRDLLASKMEDASRLEVVGRGAADPIATNDTREGQALNRRVEVLISREGTF